ncbi:hypothetical protein N782_06200 [Pontibacillus yanchengensis Y32]|uniref:Uncharacterized protein n=1 Tax=Pontibacillus yanchengensis Y32 TaxID=1385514 RepID=A0A0A2T869_9BACI|nr:hypothetical protein N782_06200 [Pontibacillus yanchengensis Y32]
MGYGDLVRDTLVIARIGYVVGADVKRERLYDWEVSIFHFEPSINDCEASLSHFEPSISDCEASLSHFEPSISDCDASISHFEPSINVCDASISHFEPSISDCDASISHFEPSISDCDASISQPKPSKNLLQYYEKSSHKQKRKRPASDVYAAAHTTWVGSMLIRDVQF